MRPDDREASVDQVVRATPVAAAVHAEGDSAMPVVLVHEGPTLTQERYEEAVRRITGGRSRLETRSDWPVEGLIVHAAGQGPRGFRVVDLWESEEAAGRFAQVLGPIMQELGVTDMPEVYPAHTVVTA
jgi:hypothetical protein